MKLVIHTKYGKFEGKEVPFDQKKYEQTGDALTKMHKAEYFCFDTEDGEVYMTKEMINNCIVQIIK